MHTRGLQCVQKPMKNCTRSYNTLRGGPCTSDKRLQVATHLQQRHTALWLPGSRSEGKTVVVVPSSAKSKHFEIL